MPGAQNNPHENVDSITYASGTVVSSDGYIVTTIGEEKGGDLNVTFSDGRTLAAEVRVVDNRSGLRLIKVDAADLASVKIGAFKALLGEPVAAVYCTDLEDRAASVGIVSAQDRTIKGFTAKVLRTDIATEAMSAGAPLVNLKSGELLGVLVAKSGDASNGSFAVPGSYVNDLLSAKKDEFVTIDRGFLGIRVGEKEPVVTEVLKDTAAEKAGVKQGDVIVVIGGLEVRSAQDVVSHIGQHHAGAEVVVQLRRDNIDQEVRVVLQAFPEPKLATTKQIPSVGDAIFGFTPDTHGEYGLVPMANLTIYPMYPVEHQLKLAENGKYKFSLLPQPHRPLAELNTVKVERSNVEKQLTELSTQVQTLTTALERLNTEIKALSEKIEESSK